MSAIKTFDNPHPGRDYTIQHEVEEFTSLCPETGHPDFAEMSLIYSPGGTCIELKSFKLYLQAYRTEGIFYEDVTNKILSDVVAACQPEWMELETRWSTRGGIHSIINASYARDDEEE